MFLWGSNGHAAERGARGVAGLVHDPDLGFAAQVLACVPSPVRSAHRSSSQITSCLLACAAGLWLAWPWCRPTCGRGGLSAASTAVMITASGMPWLQTALYWQTLRGAREISSVCSSGSWTAG
jgi:hypothetical protein